MMKKPQFSLGDNVAYSVQFLRGIGAFTGELPAARGRIVGIEKIGTLKLADIEWNNSDLPNKVNVANLAKVGLNTRFSAC